MPISVPPPVYHVELVKPLFDVSDYISIAAILLGPFIAIRLQKLIERKQDDKKRREDIFKTLMATRGATLSAPHVEALNRIDLEFNSKNGSQRVIDAWKEYFDNLSNGRDSNKESLAVWVTRNEELLANLLYEMGISLGYKFDKVLIKRNIYSPVGHSKTEQETTEIRQGLATILRGEAAFPMIILQDDEIVAKQAELQDLMIAYYTPEGEVEDDEERDE